MNSHHKRNIAVITSGGDSQGMNAALRAVVRTAIARGVSVYAVYDGYKGMVRGGDAIRQMTWDSVGGILHQGGTIIGTARSPEFRTREGQLQAAKHLVERDIDALIVIGGDGSLTGANEFRKNWAGLLAELVAKGEISQELADRHPNLVLAGLVGSIDNDMFGTDMTIGADTALHRITEAIDAIASTAASHQRVFVVEVMGRNCGYLALMSAIATGANWVFIPESPPDQGWEDELCRMLESSRVVGRRHSIIVVAEGARDRRGKPITSDQVRRLLQDRLGEDVRVTILGHVQRGGAPSAFDRWHSTMLGADAVDAVLSAGGDDEPVLIGLRQSRPVRSPLMEAVEKTHQVARLIAAKEYDQAMALRGGSFSESYAILRTIIRAHPRQPEPGAKRLRLAILHAGAPAPGMNTAARVAVRLGLDAGHTILGVRNSFGGLIQGDIFEMDWMSVHGWVAKGGAELGTNRKLIAPGDLAAIAAQIQAHRIDGILMIGGWAGYRNLYEMARHREDIPAFRIPMVCLPATINNNLPGSELSIGADTALNSIVADVDKIKQSAVATRRCFVVEVMGRECGYLALMSGLATGAERIYLPEEGITLADLLTDVTNLRKDFAGGKRLGLIIRNEMADPVYSTAFIRALFEKEGQGYFDVRTAVLGHVQQGGNPTPFDRIQATRLAAHAIRFLADEAGKMAPACVAIGLQGGKISFTNLLDLPLLMDMERQRPLQQWWLGLRSLSTLLARPPEPA
ncbi:MAG: 6-phosphofructokinase [Caldilineales bacterium]|nr:6-phosphofructokinase [Caldilineales bacterium]MDW8319539.1 6-phosphofructokinase [Anaerolineae bacterium]